MVSATQIDNGRPGTPAKKRARWKIPRLRQNNANRRS
jgi:hypothetical protein